ncbi:hypothetical protein BGW37DRAFT_491133 [Umbelopsis sp. PMI_123]|nr:hypothetical protein BGW37DRAFT_491133 [Umbelopsis sp. PMI_123]
MKFRYSLLCSPHLFTLLFDTVWCQPICTFYPVLSQRISNRLWTGGHISKQNSLGNHTLESTMVYTVAMEDKDVILWETYHSSASIECYKPDKEICVKSSCVAEVYNDVWDTRLRFETAPQPILFFIHY